MDRRGVEGVFRREYGRAVAVLIRYFGDIDLAEEAVQEAFAAALVDWAAHGVPPSPAGWIITAARNRAVDRVRREAVRGGKEAEAVRLMDTSPRADELRLIFICCHPALGLPARVALTLRLLGGLGTAEIARAFLVPESTMAQRLVRAKGKIRDAGIPYRIPRDEELPDRLPGVLAVLYLIFNEGYAASGGDTLTRDDLAAEAIRLARRLVALMPDEPEARGLLALMLLIHARRPARVGADGRLIRLADQDRGRWNAGLVSEGRELVRQCLRRGRPGPYQIQAAINAVHSDAETDWRQILSLYDQLTVHAGGSVVALHRAVAVAEVHGPAVALEIVDGLDGLDGHYMRDAVRADLLRRLGRRREAAEAYREARELTSNAAEKRFLAESLESVTGPPEVAEGSTGPPEVADGSAGPPGVAEGSAAPPEVADGGRASQ
ncbi:RNA polymerase sigma factor [Actinoplanes sp. TBRC 11911]|nr:RNA polymerase sigma factor [Actinoplanes sp. TBRC 11911]